MVPLLLLSGIEQTAWADEPLFEGYQMLPVDALPVTRASNPMAIVSGFSPAPEEALATELLQVLVRGDGTGLVVEVMARGYLDDSIAGENLLAKLERDGDQWRVIALGRQVVCARGERAVASDGECM